MHVYIQYMYTYTHTHTHTLNKIINATLLFFILFLCTQKACFSQILFTNLSKSVLVSTSPLPRWCSLHRILTLPSECRSRNRDSSDQATFSQSSVVQFWWSCVNCILRVLFFSDRSGTRCGLLLLGSTCCVFRDGILQILVVTSGYLSYCCISIISNQSVHSPLTSTRHFCPTAAHWIFSLFRTILCKP